MTPRYDGPERRKDAINEHRFTLLEGIADGNKRGIETLYARFSRLDHELKAEQRIAAAAILEALDKKADSCSDHNARIAKLETFGMLIEKIAYVFGAAITAIGGWIFHHNLHKAVKP